ncbi:MAG: hypothetical protein DMG13_05530 [Acidobacteria bacterium]|nr:MAG: hypothetical protein DMG13_05530 [Acidobacteriota bacterium]
MSSAWLVWRALLAVALTLGYFVLGITMGGALAYLGFHFSGFTDIFHRTLFPLCTFAGVMILIAMIPSWDRFVAPDPGSNRRSSRNYLKG